MRNIKSSIFLPIKFLNTIYWSCNWPTDRCNFIWKIEKLLHFNSYNNLLFAFIVTVHILFSNEVFYSKSGEWNFVGNLVTIRKWTFWTYRSLISLNKLALQSHVKYSAAHVTVNAGLDMGYIWTKQTSSFIASNCHQKIQMER